MNVAELPNRRNEAWKYSDLRAAAQDLDGWDLTPDWHKFILVADEPSSKTSTVHGGDVIANLVRATTDGGTLRYVVASGMRKSLTLDWEAIAGIGGHSVEIDIGDGAGLDLIENWIGEAGALGAGQVVLTVAPNAKVTRTVTQRASEGTVLVSRAYAKLETGARFSQFVLAEGAKLARIETHVSIEGEGAEVTLNGAYLTGAGRHADLTSVIEHKAPGGVTRQLIKGVARNGGRGVFQGKIVVERGAQKTDARQHHQGLLLEYGAEIFAKPELMIHADDVQCAHGNTAGGLDERALFYMRSRGIPEAQARALLIEAFLAETIPEGLPEELHGELLKMMRAWLAESPAVQA